jgi:ABC-type multidrug transport system fused ATPase/permease subunit
MLHYYNNKNIYLIYMDKTNINKIKDNFNNDKITMFDAYSSFFKHMPISFIISFLLIIFNVLLTVIFPKLIGKFIAHINIIKNKSLIRELIKLCLIYIFLWAGVLFHYYFMHKTVLSNSRGFFFKKLFLPIWNTIEKGNISIDNIDNNLYQNIKNFVITSTQFLQALIFTVLPLFVSVVIFMINIPNVQKAKITILVTLCLLSLCALYYKKYIMIKASNRTKQSNIVLNKIEEFIINNVAIFSFDTNEKEYNKINNEINSQYYKCSENSKVQTTFTFIFVLIMLFGFGISFYQCYIGLNTLEFKNFIIIALPMITSIILTIYNSIHRIVSLFQNYGSQQYNLDVINEYIQNNKKIKIEKFKNSNNLELKNIKFSYDNNRVLYNNLSLSFGKGINLIKGDNGSGKSTLLKVIFGINNYNSGDIYFNKTSKNSTDIKIWRKNIHYLDQTPSLFNRKVLENIYYGNCLNDLCNIREINTIIEKFHFEKIINNINKTVNAGRRGHKLSGGQRQFIALLRICSNPKPIILLDEPTSAMNPLLEDSVIKMINYLKENSIIIIVTHSDKLDKLSKNKINLSKI